jgi:hypothetical protein
METVFFKAFKKDYPRKKRPQARNFMPPGAGGRRKVEKNSKEVFFSLKEFS